MRARSWPHGTSTPAHYVRRRAWKCRARSLTSVWPCGRRRSAGLSSSAVMAMARVDQPRRLPRLETEISMKMASPFRDQPERTETSAVDERSFAIIFFDRNDRVRGASSSIARLGRRTQYGPQPIRNRQRTTRKQQAINVCGARRSACSWSPARGERRRVAELKPMSSRRYHTPEDAAPDQLVAAPREAWPARAHA